MIELDLINVFIVSYLNKNIQYNNGTGILGQLYYPTER